MIQEYTPNKSYGFNKKLFIIVHHTASNSISGAITWFKNPKSQVSAHYVIGQKGEQYKFENDDTILWHAGLSKYTLNGQYFSGFNSFSIGIEVVSDGKQYTDIQREKVKELIEYLSSKYGIGKDNILRHLDVSGYRGKQDVSDPFRNNKYISREDYKNSLSINYDKMTEKQKKLFLKSIYENNSSGRDMIEGIKSEISTEDLKLGLKRLQKQQARVNEILRDLKVK